MLRRADVIAAALRSGTTQDRLAHLAALLESISLSEESIVLTVARSGLAMALGQSSEQPAAEPLELTISAVKLRRGHQLRLVIPGPAPITVNAANRNDKLVALVAEAIHARNLVLATQDKSIAAISTKHGRCRTRLGKLARLGCLAPDIVTAVVEGRQPPALTAATLLDLDLPLCWKAQRALLGFS
jgi:hypothetical protein